MSKKTHQKPKILVRYPTGAAGTFICSLLYGFCHDIDINFPGGAAELAVDYFHKDHNFHLQWQKDISDVFFHHTSIGCDLDLATAWMAETFRFYKTDSPFYIVRTHAHNVQPLLQAWNNTRLINIQIRPEDIDQLTYNFVSKRLVVNPPHPDTTHTVLKHIQRDKGKLLWVTPELMHKVQQDLYLVCCIHKERMLKLEHLYTSPQTVQPCYNVTFDSIMDRSFVNQLPAIADFAGINFTYEDLTKAEKMFLRYLRAQTKVPWSIDIDDYDLIGKTRT